MTGRENLRIEYQIKTTIKYQDNIFEVNANNLSMEGIFVQTSESIPINSMVNLILELITDTSSMSLNINGSIMRKDKNGYAINFTDVDINSFIVLRNIVAHESFDEDKIIKEFEDTYSENAVS